MTASLRLVSSGEPGLEGAVGSRFVVHVAPAGTSHYCSVQVTPSGAALLGYALEGSRLVDHLRLGGALQALLEVQGGGHAEVSVQGELVDDIGELPAPLRASLRDQGSEALLPAVGLVPVRFVIIGVPQALPDVLERGSVPRT